MKIVVAILCLIICLSITDGKKKGKGNNKENDGQYHRGEKFKNYMKKFRSRKYYTDEELPRRERNVNLIIEIIENHNSKTNSTYKQGMNLWSDMNPQNFTRRLCGYQPMKEMRALGYYSAPVYPDGPIRDSLDWSYLMQPVRNQGTCGSCWSFATVSAIEAHMKLANPNFNSYLSRQQLVECVKENNACKGGNVARTIDWIINNGNSLALETDYPYTSDNWKEDQPIPACKAPKNQVNLKISDLVWYPIDNEDELARMVNFFGPVIVSMYVATDGKFQSYKEGIFSDPKTPKLSNGKGDISKNNHAVVVVGYGVENGMKFWIIRNSWGLSWGEGGYGKIIRGSDRNCNLAMEMVWPVIRP